LDLCIGLLHIMPGILTNGGLGKVGEEACRSRKVNRGGERIGASTARVFSFRIDGLHMALNRRWDR